MASIIIDDPSLPEVIFGGGQWNTTTDTRYFGGSSQSPSFATGSQLATDKWGWLCFQFNGTSIQIFGNSPSPPGAQNFFAIIDGGTPMNTTYNDTAPPSSLQWYQSPTLSEGTHLINFTHLAGPSVDYVVVTAGQETPLQNTRLIVDDDDDAIRYQGSWNEDSSQLNINGSPAHGQTFGNGTHRAASVGAKVTFVYTGTAIDVYGVFDFRKIGNLTVKYSLDTWTTTKSYIVTADTPNFKNGAQEVPNFQLFEYNSVAPGNHALTIEVLESENIPLILDYITYTPTFANAASKPSLSFPSTSSSGSGSSNSNSKTPIGAIVGGVVGGVILLIALILLLLYRGRRKQGRSRAGDKDLSEPKPEVQPFTLGANRRLDPSSRPDSATRPLFNAPATPPSGTISSFYADSPPISPPSGPTFAPQTKANLITRQVSTIEESSEPQDPRLMDPNFRRRMQRLQALVLELNQEIDANGENGPRVLELRGRISELTREDAESAEYITRTLVSNHPLESVVPPPYNA